MPGKNTWHRIKPKHKTDFLAMTKKTSDDQKKKERKIRQKNMVSISMSSLSYPNCKLGRIINMENFISDILEYNLFAWSFDIVGDLLAILFRW